MNALPLLANVGDLPSISDIINSSESLFVGFLFVIALLSSLAVMMSVIGRFFIRQEAREAAKVPAPAPVAAAAAPAAAPSAPAGDVHLIPVIAAAIHAACEERPHRVVSIRPAASGWAQEGRREIFSGRRVR